MIEANAKNQTIKLEILIIFTTFLALLASAQVIPTHQSHRVPLNSLKQVLLSYNYSECCPSWQNLTENLDIVEELRRLRKTKAGVSDVQLKPSDLLAELKLTFINVTYLSLEGQMGNNDRDKYYSLYDSVLYYLSLLKVSKAYLNSTSEFNSSFKFNSSQEMEFDRTFRRQLRSIEFRASKDPTLSSFINELTTNNTTNTTSQSLNPNFEYYEDFVKFTQFGQYYASRGAYDTSVSLKSALATAQAQVAAAATSEANLSGQSNRSLLTRFF